MTDAHRRLLETTRRIQEVERRREEQKREAIAAGQRWAEEFRRRRQAEAVPS